MPPSAASTLEPERSSQLEKLRPIQHRIPRHVHHKEVVDLHPGGQGLLRHPSGGLERTRDVAHAEMVVDPVGGILSIRIGDHLLEGLPRAVAESEASGR